MTRYIGPRSILDQVYAVGGMDASTILDWQNRNGLNAEQVLQRMAGAIGAANQTALERWLPYIFITDTLDAKYRDGSSARKTPRASEFAQPDAIRGTESGHMLPMYDHHDGLAWSWQYLRDAYDSQIDVDIQEVVDSWFLRVDADMINRLFSNSAEAVGGGFSLPFVDGSTAGSVTYTPPQFGANNFDSTHTHFAYENTSVTAAKLRSHLLTRVKHLREHGIRGRLICMVAEDDVDTWTGVTGFVELLPADIRIYAGASDIRAATGENEDAAGEAFGFVNTTRGYVELRYFEQIPSGYFHVTRSYGSNNPNNPVAVRLHPDQDFGLSPDVMVTRSLTPKLESISVHATHGVGINNRLNGANAYLASGASAYDWSNV